MNQGIEYISIKRAMERNWIKVKAEIIKPSN